MKKIIGILVLIVLFMSDCRTNKCQGQNLNLDDEIKFETEKLSNSFFIFYINLK